MDFSFSDDQNAIRELAAQILRDGSAPERLRALEKRVAAGETERFDPALWRAAGEAGLIGLAIPEAQGGGGQGFLELALVVEQLGRTTAPIPYLESALLCALPLAEFGSKAQRERWLPQLATGEAIGTAALLDAQADAPTRARKQGTGWKLSGAKLCVPAGQLAQLVLVPAALPDGRESVFLVEAASAGLRATALPTTSSQPEAKLAFDDLALPAGALLGGEGQGAEIRAWLELRATAALCALASGVCEEALRRTAEFSKTRKQFDQPIAMFQAVGHREADAFIDTEAVRLTAWQACWRIAEGLPAEDQVAIAKFWAAEGGQRVVHAAQHIHGGIGVDREYPVHRYFLYAKQLELTLGGATPQLVRLGRRIAEAAT